MTGPSKFERALQAVGGLRMQRGLKALGNNSSKVACKDSHMILGSVDLDKDLKDQMPQDSRWDYVIGYENNKEEKAFFVEVHPAHTSEISQIVKKAQWLKEWAEMNAKELWGMKHLIYWIATDGVHIRSNDHGLKKLSQLGVSRPVPRLDLDKCDL